MMITPMSSSIMAQFCPVFAELGLLICITANAPNVIRIKPPVRQLSAPRSPLLCFGVVACWLFTSFSSSFFVVCWFGSWVVGGVVVVCGLGWFWSVVWFRGVPYLVQNIVVSLVGLLHLGQNVMFSS